MGFHYMVVFPIRFQLSSTHLYSLHYLLDTRAEILRVGLTGFKARVNLVKSQISCNHAEEWLG